MSATPGPWDIFPTPNDPDFVYEIGSFCAIYASDANAKADAYLIAAAPDLLAALLVLTSLADGPNGGVTGAMKRDALAAARAALSKATTHD
jgi:hypothetical protein